MLPVFKEYIKFLNDKTNNELNFLKEGIFWYDKSIIKGFNLTTGELIKVVRINVDDNLNISIKKYNDKIPKLESWKETIIRFESELDNLEKESKELIKNNILNYSDREMAVLSSGGKDSSVVTYLVKLCKDNPKIIFNNTSLDCADTYCHIKKENDLTIINPEIGFYQWREKQNFIPTRFKRGCCGIFKEGAMIDYLDKDSKYLFFMGMRNQESAKRSNYGDMWKNEKWRKREWDAVLPIRKWSEFQVWLYILKNNIDINPKYKKGYSRVGCAIACPYYTKSTWVLDKYWYPKMFERWQNILREDFRKNNKDLIMNCTEEEYLICWSGGIYREEPTEEVIKQFAERNKLDIEVATNFFGHTCKICGKKIKDKNTIGMNMKIGSTSMEDMYCKKHLKEKFDIDEDMWLRYIEIFKSQGCSLF